MHKQSRTVVLLSLLCLLALGPLLSGCGGAAKEPATTATGAAGPSSQEPTEVVAEEPTEEAATELQNTFDNLIQLAPLHVASSWVSKKGEAVVSDLSYEADLDAKGNQHLTLMSSNSPTELYIVDKVMYVKADGDQYVKMGDVEDDTGFSFLTMFGGAYLLAFNDLQDAKLVGREAVGPWQADKYEIQMDLASLGVGGLVAGAQGADWDYKGNAWIEPNAKALVKAVVDWSAKGVDGAEPESWHSEFLASEGTATEITPPENIMDMSAVGSEG